MNWKIAISPKLCRALSHCIEIRHFGARLDLTSEATEL